MNIELSVYVLFEKLTEPAISMGRNMPRSFRTSNINSQVALCVKVEL